MTMPTVQETQSLVEDWLEGDAESRELAAMLNQIAEAMKESEDAKGEAAEEFEHYIQTQIDHAPDVLRRLGQYLAKVLDEDQWKTVDKMLLGLAINASAPSDEARDALIARLRDFFEQINNDSDGDNYQNLSADALDEIDAAMQRGDGDEHAV